MNANYKLVALDSSSSQWEVINHVFVGGDPSCKIRIFDGLVASKQAVIEIRHDKLFIKNLMPQNNIIVNQTVVIEAQLTNGDQLSIGSQQFLVHDTTERESDTQLKSNYSPWSEQLKSIYNVAKTNYPVLLLGPSGTGKDVLAQSIHKNSLCSRGPFLSVNCSALTETLVESELFGHIKGSFTGAVSDRKGAFEAARNGTLFLDEIGDLPYSLQAKLLRALENGEIRPVGSDRSIKTQVRVIAATHQNLHAKIQDGSFRTDLFYRLNVVTVSVPSLKERIEDFDQLFYTFARELKVRFSHDAILKLKRHDWPGNIRELKNLVSRASALFPNTSIEAGHIDKLIHVDSQLHGGTRPDSEHSEGTLSVIKEIEKQMIIKRLTVNSGNQKKTAQELGMPKSTLHDRIRSYKISLDEFRRNF